MMEQGLVVTIMPNGLSDYSDPDRVTVSGVTVQGPGIRDVFVQALKAGIDAAFKKQGAHAFKCPKVAAAAHEAGHIVVAATLGYVAKNAKLVESKDGSGIWGGITNLPEHIKTPIIDAETALRHARILYAGIAGEMFLKPEFVHTASSIDEVAMSQLIVKAFVVDDQNDAEKCWNETVHYDVVARLGRNQSALEEIANKLFRQGQMRQPQLRKLLTKIVER